MLVSTASSSIFSLRITRCLSLHNTCYLVHSTHKMTFYIKMDKLKPQGFFFQCPNHVETRTYVRRMTSRNCCTLNVYGFLDFICALCWSSTDVSANITIAIISVNVFKVSRNFGETLIVKRRGQNPNVFLCIIYLYYRSHSSKETSSPNKKKERIPFETRPGACISIFLLSFSAEIFW